MTSLEPNTSTHFANLVVNVYPSSEALAKAAAQDIALRLTALASEHETVPVIFATGISQLATLQNLVTLPGVPWHKVIGFHMDDYIGMSEEHLASFHRYLREHLIQKVHLRGFYAIKGNEPNPQVVCREYAELLRANKPLLCLLGIGENGHLAFNDPAEADFHDPDDVKIVTLDQTCRQQQVNEGWFRSLQNVPPQAITLTIPALLRTPEIIVSVPGVRKAQIVKRTLEDPLSTACPATILRTHPKATVYLDRDSAALISS